ncbi:MAG: [LysW]-aminoadipate kinase [Candidatus Lokiarchaeota archaeon]|nr:[LysW]-aminoadipate kinase [Candidatus Lokiarchaeota archaeon]MBD3198668.1 [LysW]-aminoadipate kinase [Candidatus Lokiarchaeota archaeon]
MKVVIKVGGSLLAKNFSRVIDDISIIYNKFSDNYKLIIVHGGGPQINEFLRETNKEPKYFITPSGFKTRYTDKEAIEAAIMALGGRNNKRLVEALQKRGVNSFGFTGIDGGIIEAKRKEKILVMINNKRIFKRGEFSGKIEKVNKEIINFLIESKYLPVIGSLAKSEKGEIVNVDGDRAASYIASSIGAEILISLTDVEGIYKDYSNQQELIKKISKEELKRIVKDLEGGMKKKVYAALEALNMGIKEFIICSGLIESPISNSLQKNTGTVILNE